LERESWSDDVYQYEIPYVASSKYDLHVLNLLNGSVHSFPGLNSGSLDGLRRVISGCKGAVLSEARLRLPSSHSDKQKAINKYIYTLDQFFLVDQGRLLIFSLANLEDEKLYYSLDLTRAEGVPLLRAPSELAAKYPDELVVTERAHKNPFEDRRLTVSGKQYRIERAALLPSGVVVLGQENLMSDYPDSEPVYSDHRSVLGIGHSAPESDLFDRIWEYKLNYEGPIDDFIEDSKDGRVYFPELKESGWFTTRFGVEGLAGTDGRSVEAIPANFKAHLKEGKLDEVRIVGTVVDFERDLLFIHDYEKNRLVCANLRPKRQQ